MNIIIGDVYNFSPCLDFIWSITLDNDFIFAYKLDTKIIDAFIRVIYGSRRGKISAISQEQTQFSHLVE